MVLLLAAGGVAHVDVQPAARSSRRRRRVTDPVRALIVAGQRGKANAC